VPRPEAAIERDIDDLRGFVRDTQRRKPQRERTTY
jgi:hypothetical protein